MSKHNYDCYCLNCLNSFRTKKYLNHIKKYVKMKVFVMLFKDTNVLEFNQYRKTDKRPFVIYADLEPLLEKIDGCKTNPEKSSTTKRIKHVLSGYSISTISSFEDIKNN